MSVPCVLVTPKRKLAGRLAVMKNVLHFFCEFLVESTGGSSVFKSFHAASNHDSGTPNQLGRALKQKSNLNLDSEKGNTSENTAAVHENILQKQPKNIKRHQRWHISKVIKSYTFLSDFNKYIKFICSGSQFFYSFIFITCC